MLGTQPTGLANARPMINSAKQSILSLHCEMDCFASLAMTMIQHALAFSQREFRRVGKGAVAPCPPLNVSPAMVGTLALCPPHGTNMRSPSRDAMRPRLARILVPP